MDAEDLFDYILMGICLTLVLLGLWELADLIIYVIQGLEWKGN